jgi:hypothetical protein
MRIQWKTEGGLAYFPGLSRPVTLESSTLPEAEAAAVRRLVEAARFFDLPPTVGTPARGAADYHRYTITIEDGGQRHTVQATDPVEDPTLQALLTYLKGKATALRTEARQRASDPPPDGPR